MIEKEILIGECQKNQRELLRVTLENFNGHDLINLRVWFQAADGDRKPGTKGLSLNVRMIPELLRLLQRASDEATKIGALSAA